MDVNERIAMMKALKDQGFEPQVMLYANPNTKAFLWVHSPEAKIDAGTLHFALTSKALEIQLPGVLNALRPAGGEGQIKQVPAEFLNQINSQQVREH